MPNQHSTNRRVIVEEVIWLTDCGESPEQVARQLGYASASNLASILYRWGEPSLARRLTGAEAAA